MEETCPNCGHDLGREDRFCSSCGQETRERILPFREVLLDILRDSFAFDSRFLRTLPTLLFRPGTLTREFMAGRRMRYIPAVRLYVFSSVIAFALVSWGGTPRYERDTPDRGPVEAGVHVSHEDEGVSIGLSDPRSAAELDSLAAQIDRMGVEAWSEDHVHKGPLMQRFLNKLVLIDHLDRQDEVVEQLWRDLPLIFLLVVPLAALLIKVFFRKAYYVVHLVFSFHLGAFVMCGVSILHVLGLVVGWTLKGYLILLAPVHFMLALRQVHRISWPRMVLVGPVLVIGVLLLILLALALALVVMVTLV